MPSRRPLTWRWVVLLVLLAVLFIAFRTVHALAEPAEDTAVYTEKVVVVGVAGRYQLSDTDRAVVGASLDNVQVGAVSVRPRYIGDCAAAGWETLGAGRRTGVAQLCDPQVQGRQVVDWPQRLAAAARQRGDARLGTLAASVTGCVAAVGPGAALAAARPDGTLAAYQSVADFVTSQARLSCPITLVDAGNDSDPLIAELARQRDVTLFVSGIGPTAGSADPNLQVIYRVGTTLPGWLTSSSTRRQGVVTLTDLTRTLIDFGNPDADQGDSAIDGAPLQVDEAALTLEGLQQQLRSVAALSSAAVTGYLTLLIGGGLLVLLALGCFLLRRFLVPHLVLTLGCVLGAAMTLTGAVPWNESSHPGLVVSLVVSGWAVALTAVALGLARAIRCPVAVVGAALIVATITADAALGAVLEPGSLLNSRPVAGGRWYGFGNVTFSVYATAALVLGSYLAHRFRRTGHPRTALVSMAGIGLGVVICEGWPTMGTDFGGVIALMPGVLWLLLVLSGLRVTWVRLLGLGGAAVLAISAISYLDWRRGPNARTHLGNFVQRIIDGDAADIVSRKAVASAESIVSVAGLIALVLGVSLWVLAFRRLLASIVEEFSTIRPLAIATLSTAILGTVLNDGGIWVWLTVTGAFMLTLASLWVGREAAPGRASRTVRASR